MVREMAKCPEVSGKKDLYFPIDGIKYDDLAEMSQPVFSRGMGVDCIIAQGKQRSTATGRVANVNGRKIALVKYRGRVFAMDEQCPHMGGPLHLGDIEEIGAAGLPCIVCPWHNWKYNIYTGEIESPLNRNVKVTVYPVKVKPSGCLYVAFESISPDYFNSGDF